jgi:hypothetical protein
LEIRQRYRDGNSQRAREAWEGYLANAPATPLVAFPHASHQPPL